MKRSDVIVQCLHHSGCGLLTLEIKQQIEEVFHYYYPYENYGQWDIEISDTRAYAFSRTNQVSSVFHIFYLIQHLWDVY